MRVDSQSSLASPANSNELGQVDFLVIGGGTAGAVMAARLSESHRFRVTLVEAGMDTPPEQTPSDIKDTFPSSTLNPAYFWPGLKASIVAGDEPRPYPQARIMGGGSSIMGMFALRGLPTDFARWAEAGALGWSWEQAVRMYEKVESDLSHADGPCGTTPISRMPVEEWPAFVRALRDAAHENGLPYVDNINTSPGDGFFPMPSSRNATSRSTSASCYLTPEVRRRTNLTIMSRSTVTRLVFDAQRACGAWVEQGGTTRLISARKIIVCAGAIHSPALLLRSGVGEANHLVKHGIRPIVHLQGVGQNLQNHSYLFYALTLPRGKRLASDLRRFAVAGIRASSMLANCPRSDLLLFVLGRVSPQAFGTSVAMVGSALYSPFSKGSVTLTSPDPHEHPLVEFRMLDDARDGHRVVQGARLVERLLSNSQVAACYDDAFLLPSGMAVNQFNRPGLAGAVMSAGATAVLNGPRAIRRMAIGHALGAGAPLSERQGGHYTEEQILQSIAPMGHPVGTCAMGPADNPRSVVDSEYRVLGVTGLYVVDASVMPVIPSANTNLPTLMLAEHAAERVLAGEAHR